MFMGLYFLMMGVVVLLFRGLQLLPHSSEKKLGRAFQLRKKQGGQWPWLIGERSPSSQLFWFHCSSGEFEYAKPVIRELKKQAPDCQILVTYFSPSVAKSVARFPLVDFSFVAPWDLPTFLKEFLHHWRPSCLAIARTDLWPGMLWVAQKNHIPTVLFSTTFEESSARHVWWRAWFYRRAYSLLTKIYTVSDADLRQFEKLIPDLATPVQILGDTRFDQAVERLNEPQPATLANLQESPHPILVLGSTWPEDEEKWYAILDRLPTNLRLWWAPHEPTAAHLEELQAQTRARGRHFALLSESPNVQDSHFLLIDQVGILADLYRWADLAFVGGSFRQKVHSVMEPLAAGCLVAVGPFYKNNREAQDFSQIPSPKGEKLVTVCSTSMELFSWVERNMNATSPRPFIQNEVARRLGASQVLAHHLLEVANVPYSAPSSTKS